MKKGKIQKMQSKMDKEQVVNRLHQIKDSLPLGVHLVAVSKFRPAEFIRAAYDAGQRIFGESQEKELSLKVEELPNDIQWHFIGHLQTNKVKYIARYISLIESVDSLKLLKEINRQAIKNNRVIDVLLELHVAQEETKSGLTPDDCLALLEEGEWKSLSNVRICGLMTMASYCSDEQQIASEFATAHQLFNKIKEKYFSNKEYFKYRSWGMSGDYKIAIEHEANLVRIGTTIFGEREY